MLVHEKGTINGSWQERKVHKIYKIKSHAIYFRDTVVFVCATVQQ